MFLSRHVMRMRSVHSYETFYADTEGVDHWIIHVEMLRTMNMQPVSFCFSLALYFSFPVRLLGIVLYLLGVSFPPEPSLQNQSPEL